jgi:dTDP-4-dehydrorhamnose 3,5-epimerase
MALKIIDTGLPGVKMIVPDVFSDERGYFMETHHQIKYAQEGLEAVFVQDNLSFSHQGVVRGLHYQLPHEQAKLIQVIKGEIFDVAIDIRKKSPTHGRWTGLTLSDENKRQIYIPEGFAHGFFVVSETALVMYKCTAYYSPQSEKGIVWNDPDLNIEWSVNNPIVSEKDRRLPLLKNIPKNHLPG